MNMFSKWRLTAAMALMITTGMLWGCAQEVGDIDRTQPDKIEKALFQTDDEWYLQQTIVDTGMEGGNIGDGSFMPAGPMAFKALEGPLKRVRWTITENVLYAHSSVELADGVMEGFDEEDARRLGIVAAFPIQGHFDVQRQYNAATGEQSNVIVENASDRPWYERDYMRVDWGTNLIDGIRMFQGMIGSFSPVSQTKPQNDSYIDPNRTRISDDYIDTVTEYKFQPDIYSCFGAFGIDSIWSCEGGRASIRTAMMRVPEEKTYVPLNYLDTQEITRDGTPATEPLKTANIYDPELGYMVEVECTDTVRDWLLLQFGQDGTDRCRQSTFDFHGRFGYFRTERLGWDRYAGDVDYNRRYYANRWNIWQTMLDENGNILDPADRTPQPITYYLNLEYPKFMFDAAQETAADWDDAFREAAMLAMGIDDTELDAILLEEYGHNHMFRIVENSCHPGPLVDWYNEHGQDRSVDRDSVDGIFSDYIGSPTGDEAMESALWAISTQARENLCAELEYATETRGSVDEQFTWERFGDLRFSFFNWVEESVPWAGYGPSSADPKTGELIRGNANFAGAYIRRAATAAADLVQYFNGELSDEDLLHGVQIRDDLFHNERDSELFGLTTEARREMAMRAGVDPDELEASQTGERINVEDLDPFILYHGKDEVMRQANIASEFGRKRNLADDRVTDFMSDPAVKNMMLGDVELGMAVEALALSRHGGTYDDDQFHQAYLDIVNPGRYYEQTVQRDRLLSERNIMTLDALQQSAEMLITYRGVTDYFKGKSRDEIIKYFMDGMFIGTQLHEIGHTVGLRHNFSSHADALNYYDEFWILEQAIQSGQISRADAQSLQKDAIAEIFGEEMAEKHDYLSQAEFKLGSIMDYTADNTGRFGGLAKYDRAAINFAYGEVVEQWSDEYDLPNLLSYETWLTDYRDLPMVFGTRYADSGDPYAAGVEIILNGREYVPIQDVIDAHREGIIDNTTRWETYSFDDLSPPYVDRTVEYNFCSDEFRGLRLDCEVWAYGANQTETVNHAFDTYRALQTFWRHRRHRVDGGNMVINNYINRLMRTFAVSADPFRFYSIFRFFNLGDYTDDLIQASMDGFNFYAEVLAMPEPGRFCMYDEEDVRVDQHWYYDLENTYVPASWHNDRGACDDYIDIPLGRGQEYGFAFSPDYLWRLDRVGTYMDKWVASQMLFNISAQFAQSEFFTDERATNLSYWTLFKDEMLNILGGIILGDFKAYGASVNESDWHFPKPVDPATFGTGATDPTEGAPRIFTRQSFNHEFNMLVYGLLTSDFMDRQVDFTHYVKIATTVAEAQEFGDGIDLIHFEHPTTGQIYTAADIEGRTVSGRLLERAEVLADRYVEARDALEQATPGTSHYDQLRTIKEIRREQMQDVVSSMDMMRWALDAVSTTYR